MNGTGSKRPASRHRERAVTRRSAKTTFHTSCCRTERLYILQRKLRQTTCATDPRRASWGPWPRLYRDAGHGCVPTGFAVPALGDGRTGLCRGRQHRGLADGAGITHRSESKAQGNRGAAQELTGHQAADRLFQTQLYRG